MAPGDLERHAGELVRPGRVGVTAPRVTACARGAREDRGGEGGAPCRLGEPKRPEPCGIIRLSRADIGAGVGTVWLPSPLRMPVWPMVLERTPGPRPDVHARTGECWARVPMAAADVAARRGGPLTMVVLGAGAARAGLLQRHDAESRAAAGARADPPIGAGRLTAPTESTPTVALQRRITSRRSTMAVCKLMEREPRRPSSSSHWAMMTFLNISD